MAPSKALEEAIAELQETSKRVEQRLAQLLAQTAQKPPEQTRLEQQAAAALALRRAVRVQHNYSLPAGLVEALAYLGNPPWGDSLERPIRWEDCDAGQRAACSALFRRIADALDAYGATIDGK